MLGESWDMPQLLVYVLQNRWSPRCVVLIVHHWMRISSEAVCSTSDALDMLHLCNDLAYTGFLGV